MELRCCALCYVVVFDYIALSGFMICCIIFTTTTNQVTECLLIVLQYIFTTLKTTGRDGPTSTSGYVNTLLEGTVHLDKGIQIWATPYTGTYTIETFGASGRNGTAQNSAVWRLGGLGARMKGTFYLKKGTKLKILVGQQGTWTPVSLEMPGPGGGGTFVTLLDNTPLIIAGGGGGGSPSGSAGFTDGDPGQITRSGTRYGGSDGNGGRLYNTDNASFCSSSPRCSAGSGLLSQGCSISGVGEPSSSFVDGGRGARFITGDGGFGGGGYAMLQGGGGGGYSGGGVIGNATSGTAGGGGSLNTGLAQDNRAGVNRGDGRVVITLVEREV